VKRTLILAALIFVAHTSAALADDWIQTGYTDADESSGYLRLSLGSGRTDFSGGASTDGFWGFGMEAAAGVTFSDRVRWDFVELAYNGPEFPGALGGGSRLDLQTTVWIGDFDPNHRFHPFFGAGVGSARYSESNEVDWGFAWNAGAGFEFQLTSELAIGPRYTFRRMDLDVPTGVLGVTEDVNVNTHEFTLSIVWSN
jgi:opacity protein-like surface antigen